MMKRLWMPICWAFVVMALSNIAYAQLSKDAFDAVANKHVEITVQDEQKLRGSFVKVGDTTAVFVTDGGDVQEFALGDVTQLRVVTDTAKAESIEPSQAAAKQPYSPYTSQEPSGYLPPPNRHPYVYANQFEYGGLTAQDYREFQDRMRSSRIQRGIGWTLFAVGAMLVIDGWANTNEAYGYNPRKAQAMVVTGMVTTFVGLPIAIAGRHQYRAAQEFAEEAAQARRELSYGYGHRHPVNPAQPSPPGTIRQRPSESLNAVPSSQPPAVNAHESSPSNEGSRAQDSDAENLQRGGVIGAPKTDDQPTSNLDGEKKTRQTTTPDADDNADVDTP